MADFIVNTFAEIADFFISFGVDKVIGKFAERNKSKLCAQTRASSLAGGMPVW